MHRVARRDGSPPVGRYRPEGGAVTYDPIEDRPGRWVEHEAARNPGRQQAGECLQKKSRPLPGAVANPVSYAGDEKGRWEPPGVAPVDGPRDPAPTHGIMGAAIDLGPARRKTDGDVLEDRPCEEPDAQPTPSISSGHEPPRGVRRFARARYRLGHGPARGPPRQSTPAGMPPRRPSGG